MRTSDREQLEQEATKAMKKLGSSKDFLESHLMRASVLTPFEDDAPSAPRRGTEAPPSSSGTPAGGPPTSGSPGRGSALTTIESGVIASPSASGAAALSNGSGSGEEEEEEHHAAGMGATAVSVVVRGNQVVVANTGECRLVEGWLGGHPAFDGGEKGRPVCMRGRRCSLELDRDVGQPCWQGLHRSVSSTSFCCTAGSRPPDLAPPLLYAGDSRCVLSKRGQARALTLDHKPILFEEAKRIIKVQPG
jgi:hypothetical protein